MRSKTDWQGQAYYVSVSGSRVRSIVGPWRLDLLAGAALFVLGLLALHPAFATGFVLTDDHEILSFSAGAGADPQLGPPLGLVDRIFVQEIAGGRFRPMYWVLRYAEISLLQTNALAWHVIFVAFGIASAMLLFAALRLGGVTRFAALLAGAWLLLAPGVSSIWFRLGPNETHGVVLLLIAAYCAARGASQTASRVWDALFTVALSAAVLTKEPFALTPPALVGLRLFLRYRCRGRAGLTGLEAWLPTVIPLAMGLAVLLVAVTVASSAAESYGGRILSGSGSWSGDATPGNLGKLLLLGGFVGPLLLLGVAIEAWRRKHLTVELRDWLFGVVLALFLIGPQLVVYRTGAGFGVGRYVLPAGLGLIAGLTAGMAWLHQRGFRRLSVASATLLTIAIAFFGVLSWQDAESFRADSAALAHAADTIAASASQGSDLVIAADPVLNYEAAVSFPYQTAWRGRSDLDSVLLAAPAPDADPSQSAALARSFHGRVDAAQRGCSAVDAVVLLAPEERVLELMPCLASPEFRHVSSSETTAGPTFVPPPFGVLFEPVTMSYQLLLRAR